MKAYDVIIKPILSEKSYADIANKKYTFLVAKNTNKIEVRQAVEEIFGVQVESVNIANINGKLKRQGRSQGYTSDYKKAYVQLKKDSKAIEFFESLA